MKSLNKMNFKMMKYLFIMYSIFHVQFIYYIIFYSKSKNIFIIFVKKIKNVILILS